MVAVIALLVRRAAAPASAQGVREGKMRILGRATIEAVPDHVTVQVGIIEPAASPTAALDQNSAVARKIIDFSKEFRRRRAGHPDRLGQPGAELQNRAGAERDDATGTGRLQREQHGHGSSSAIFRVSGAFMRQILDQGATNIAGVHFGLTNLEKLSDEARTKAVEDAVRQAQGLWRTPPR